MSILRLVISILQALDLLPSECMDFPSWVYPLVDVCYVLASLYTLCLILRRVWDASVETRAFARTLYARVLAVATPGDRVPGRERVEASVRSTEFSLRKSGKANPHGEAAAVRSAVDRHMNNSIKNAGLKPWSLSSSSKDARLGIDGQRYHRTAKDGKMEVRDDELTPDHVVKLVDVDHYLCWDEIKNYAMYVVPMCIYAIAPKSPNGTSGEMSFSYSSTSKTWHFWCPATEPYNHPLWNWGASDHYFFSRTFVAALWITGYVACYIGTWYFKPCLLVLIGLWYCAPICGVLSDVVVIDRGHNREEVWLFPVARYHPVGALLRALTLHYPTLERLQPDSVEAGGQRYNTMRVHTKTGVKYAMGLDEGDTHVTVPKSLVERCLAMRGQQKTNLSCGAIIAEAARMDVKLTNGEAAVVLLAGGVNFGHAGANVFEHDRDFSYEPDWMQHSDDTIPGMTAFMHPLCDGARAPRIGPGAVRVAYEHRIQRVKCNKTTIPDHVSMCATEFAGLLSEHVGTCYMVGEDEIYAHQNRPMQRAILDRVKNAATEAFGRVSCFVKREAYSDLKAPRYITTSDKGKMRFSQFCHGVCARIRERGVHWYAFGMSNRLIAERVIGLVQSANHVDETDFSKFDGTYSPAYRLVELMFYQALIPEENWREFENLLRGTYDNTVSTGYGWAYQQGSARGSGFPDTSLGNTIANAFINYCALRTVRVNGRFLDPHSAWERLGLYGGDDGLTAGLPEGALDKQATSLGFLIKSQRKTRCDRDYVTFLARYWGPDVWNGELDSCADIRRQVVKLHLTACQETPMAIIRAKALSIVVNDGNTPILGDWARAVLRVTDTDPRTRNVAHKRAVERVLGTQYRNDQVLSTDDAYPNERRDWMLTLLDEQFGGPDTGPFMDWCSNLSLSTLFMPPAIAPPVEMVNSLPEPMVVDGLIVEPTGLMPEPTPPLAAPQQRHVHFATGHDVCVACGKPNRIDENWLARQQKSRPGFARPKRCKHCLVAAKRAR